MSNICPNTIASIFILVVGIHLTQNFPSRIDHFSLLNLFGFFCAQPPPSPDNRQWGGPLAAKPPDGPLCCRNNHPVPPLRPPCFSSLPFPSYSQSFSDLIFCSRFFTPFSNSKLFELHLVFSRPPPSHGPLPARGFAPRICSGRSMPTPSPPQDPTRLFPG